MRGTGQILALDLAKRTGWALGYATDRIPESGSVRFGKEGSTLGATLSACRAYLYDFLSAHPEVGLVVFEAPLVPAFSRGKSTVATGRALTREIDLSKGFRLPHFRQTNIWFSIRGRNLVRSILHV